MKRIIATTAFALMLSGSALAETQAMKFNTYTQDAKAQTITASDFIGMRVYALEKDFDAIENNSEVSMDATKEWDDIGEINDVILGRDGEVKAVVLGVGGFIGMGEKDVAVPMQSIKFVNEKDDAGDFFLVVNANKQALADAEGYKRHDRMTAAETVEQKTEQAAETVEQKTEEAAKTVAENTEQAAETVEQKTEEAAKTVAENTEQAAEAAEKTAENAASEAERAMLKAPAVEREGYAAAERDQLTTEDLTGARVYGSNDEDIGEIDRLLVTDNGQIDRAVIDVGGFLGLGEHPIAVTLDELQILRNKDGELRIYIDGTQAELEQQPAFRD